MLFGLLNLFCDLLFSPVENFNIFHCFQFSKISWWCALVWVFFYTFVGYSQSGNLLLIQFWEIYLNYFILFGVYFVWYMKLLKMSILVSLCLWNFHSLILWYFSLLRVLCFAYAFFWFHGCSVLLCWGYYGFFFLFFDKFFPELPCFLWAPLFSVLVYVFYLRVSFFRYLMVLGCLLI